VVMFVHHWSTDCCFPIDPGGGSQGQSTRPPKPTLTLCTGRKNLVYVAFFFQINIDIKIIRQANYMLKTNRF
jgi:hypothetical protein